MRTLEKAIYFALLVFSLLTNSVFSNEFAMALLKKSSSERSSLNILGLTVAPATTFCGNEIFEPSFSTTPFAIQKQSHLLSNTNILDSFFKNLFQNTTAGYVIYGEKPVYLGSFCQPEWLMPGTLKHQKATHTFLALKALNTFARDSKSSNYILVNQAQANTGFYGIEFMLVNCKAFLNTVENNLVLFKYKFGWSITSECLLEKLLNSDKGFAKLFEKEIALQGIVLGYGTNNSISYERGSAFEKVIIPNMPSSPPNRLPLPPATEEEMISKIENSSMRENYWLELKEETKDFSNYHPQNLNDRLKIPFSFHKNSSETKKIISMYRKAEAKLSRALTNKKLLNQTLMALKLDQQTILDESKNKLGIFFTKEAKTCSHLLAQSIHDTFSDQISPEFFNGMRAAQKTSEVSKAIDFKETTFFEILREQGFSSKTRRESIQESLQFLQKIANNPDVRCLVKDKLYYKTLKSTGFGKPITPYCKGIQVNFVIKGMDGQPIAGVYKGDEPLKLETENLIPGLAHGILGMCKGDIREVYIHPDFAYGSFSKFGNGKTLQVQIELINIEEGSGIFTLPSLQPIDVINFAPQIESCEKFEALQKKYHYLCGMKTWLHYKQAGQLVNLNDVIDKLMSKNIQPLSDQERDDISSLNWLIYQQ